MSQMTLITGPERRRRWSEAQKRAILAEADAPGAMVSEVARRADICTSLIYRWRQARRSAAGFVPAVLVGDTPVAPHAGATKAGAAAIVVEMACGGRVSIGASAPAALVTAALKALK